MSDVALLAEVSTMTVSRVLNDSPHVAEQVRKRVRAAVKTLRYSRNDMARALREQRSRQIGIVVPNLYDPFFSVAAEAINGLAKEKGYSVVISTSNDNPTLEFEETCRMARRSIEGVIVTPAPTQGRRSLLKSPELARTPMVSIDRPVDHRVDSVTTENSRGISMATQHLLALSHVRILYVGIHDHLYTMRLREQGYAQSMEAGGQRPRVLRACDTPAETLQRLRKVLRSSTAPTAIVTGNNLVTRHVLHALLALNLTMPDDVALVGFDDFETATLIQPGISVVRQPIQQIGRAAAELLFARLEDRSGSDGKPTQSIVLPVELIVRGSCGAPAVPLVLSQRSASSGAVRHKA